jgi:arylsulfatase A-like enzyme
MACANSTPMVARLLEALKRKGYLDDAVVAITSDHGDSLGEHGSGATGTASPRRSCGCRFSCSTTGTSRNPTLDPLAWPSQVDIAPTIVAELGMPRPATWSGVALQLGPVRRDFIYLEQGSRLGLVDGRDGPQAWKYWEDLRDGKAVAFDLRRDPHEARNALDEVPAARLREWREALAPIKAQYVAGSWK